MHLTTVIPAYNGERYILETLRSVARQERRPDRLVVQDNCSTDGTRRIVEAFTEMPCEWRQNERNLGLFGNLNRALEFAPQTDFLHILHADDLIKPPFYARLIASLESVPGRGLAYCGSELIDENGASIGGPVETQFAEAMRVPPRDFLLARAELRPFYCPAVLLKTGRAASPVEFRMDMPQLADIVFWAAWARHCEGIVEVPQNLCQYRLHSGSDTGKNLSSLQAWVLDEWKAMEMIGGMADLKGFEGWLWRQKLRCIFAARSAVKIQTTRGNSPELAREIARAGRRVSGPLHWTLGKAAAWLRGAFRYSGRR